jgi:LacI family transcriptional regulator
MVNKRITIKDVAQYAGVSFGTVSRFINQKGYVGAESRSKIEKAIEELHYFPNSTARSMVSRKSNIVGVAVPEINNPFLADLVVKIEECLIREKYSMMLCNTQYKQAKIEPFVDDLIMRGAEGLILVSSNVTNENVINNISRYLTVISVGQHVGNFDCVKFTDYKSAYELTKYMIENGHKRISFIGYHPNASQTMERLNGYKDALKNAGIKVRKEYLVKAQGGYKDAQTLLNLSDRPTAMMAVNDFYALNAYSAIEDAGLIVGSDVSVVAFDDISFARQVSPALTTVRCDTQQMANMATYLLFQNINSGKRTSAAEVILPSEVVIRNSVTRII